MITGFSPSPALKLSLSCPDPAQAKKRSFCVVKSTSFLIFSCAPSLGNALASSSALVISVGLSNRPLGGGNSIPVRSISLTVFLVSFFGSSACTQNGRTRNTPRASRNPRMTSLLSRRRARRAQGPGRPGAQGIVIPRQGRSSQRSPHPPCAGYFLACRRNKPSAREGIEVDGEVRSDRFRT